MASWIIHFRLVEKLLNDIPNLDPELFGIGNIAPDSGIPDKNWENFDPPQVITHFYPEKKGKFRSEDVRFYIEYMRDVDAARNPNAFSFILGYFFHLITDNLWGLKIIRPIMQKNKSAFEADPRFIKTVKKDWYGLDFKYVRSNPKFFYWKVFLNSEYDRNDLDFLPLHAVQQHIGFIKENYQRQDEEVESWINHELMFITVSQMDDFIEETVDILIKIYERIWHTSEGIWEEHSFLEGIL